jgi:hypothetical protein
MGERPWFRRSVHACVAVVCALYLNSRAQLVPKWGQWYACDDRSLLLQLRAFMSGHLAATPHPTGAPWDYFWGRGGMHHPWGLGLPLLATPFHLVARVFGALGFPDSLRFLAIYVVVTFVLATSLHATSPRKGPKAVATSGLVAAFMVTFPTYVGMISSRFLVYEETIAVGALWNLLALACLLLLVARPTTRRLVIVCAVAGFSIIVRPTLGTYAFVTAALALLVARRAGLGAKQLAAGVSAFAAVLGLYLLFNTLRFGSPFVSGYENCIAGSFVNRLNRWGLPFSYEPFYPRLKETFATFFLLEPVSSQLLSPPPSLQPYVVGERYREYYAPTYDLWILAAFVATFAIVALRIKKGRLWEPGRKLDSERITLLGSWAIPPVVALAVFYSGIGNLVSRYATDLFPALVAAVACSGMAIADALRRRAPRFTTAGELLLCGLAGIYGAGWRGWVTGLSHPCEAKDALRLVSNTEAASRRIPPPATRFDSNERHDGSIVVTQLSDWQPDGRFASGFVFAMPHSPCVELTLRSASGQWNAQEEEALQGIRLNADFDSLERCGPAKPVDDARVLVMCEPRRPRFLLDGLRLHSLASLDGQLRPIQDRLRLLRIDSVPSCR